MRDVRVILIGGTSHIGKSTLAQSLADRLGWELISTDRLARHPGRPWGRVPEHVPEHYLLLSVDELVADVLRHYRHVWSLVEPMIAGRSADLSTRPLIIEGSALWPEFVASADLDGVAAFWLTASRDTLQRRIHAASNFQSLTEWERMTVRKFLDRTFQFDAAMMEAVRRLGLDSVDIDSAPTLDALSDKCLELVGK